MITDDIIHELQYIPENKLKELYHLIHYFRVGLMTESESDLSIDTKLCLSTLNKIKQGDLSNFSEIKDVDAHIQALKNEIN